MLPKREEITIKKLSFHRIWTGDWRQLYRDLKGSLSGNNMGYILRAVHAEPFPTSIKYERRDSIFKVEILMRETAESQEAL